ncbi:MAG: hypothetical protein IJO93_01010 [Clostridia bacterium]|nr:hypothetical protein [Clostridia bacterium]
MRQKDIMIYTALICVLSAFVMFASGCDILDNGATTDSSGVLQSDFNISSSASDSTVSGSTDLDTVLGYAQETVENYTVLDGDILIAYNADTFEACCFSVEDGAAQLMYEGDYKGSYSKLLYINEAYYDDWGIMIYRIDADFEVATPSDSVDELAQEVLDNYLSEYGNLAGKAFIYILDSEGLEYQYKVKGKEAVFINEDDEDFDIWRSGDASYDYWAKLTCEETENGDAWAVYEYDEVCSEAFDDIVDTHNSMIDSGQDVQDGTVFVWKKDYVTVIMEYENSSMLYMHEKLFRKSDYTALDISDIHGISEHVSVYVISE